MYWMLYFMSERNVEITYILLSQISANPLTNLVHRSMLCLSFNLMQSPNMTLYMLKHKFLSLNL